MAQTFLTAEGKKQLEDKLVLFKTVKRPEVIKKIGIAREFGDLSENAEYDAAKEEQARLEAEIEEMETKLRTCVVIEDTKRDKNKINIGSQVKLYDQTFDEEVVYKIIGSTESDPFNGLISNESPVGSALIGKRVGDEVTVEMPNNVLKFKVLEIK